MSFTDYLVSLLLISVVVRQMWGRKLTVYSLLWPIALVIFIGSENFKGVPTQGHDVPFIILVGLLGAALGVLCGLLTRVTENKKGILIAKATGLAAAVWIVGTGMRVAFALYVTHGGASGVEKFSVNYHLTGDAVWACALLLMSLAEVVGRTAVLAVRAISYHEENHKQVLDDHQPVAIAE